MNSSSRARAGNGPVARRVLVATDGSDSASRAVETAATLAKAIGAELVVLSAGRKRLSDAEASQARRLGVSEGDLLDSLSQNIFAEARRAAKKAGMERPRSVECVGDPAAAILQAVRDERPEFVVLGRRGRGRLAGLLLGSVSQKIASLAPCRVVLVP